MEYGAERSERCLDCWNLIKGHVVPSISPRLYSWTNRGGPSNLVTEPEGLESKP
jgi:hypothetical protein